MLPNESMSKKIEHIGNINSTNRISHFSIQLKHPCSVEGVWYSSLCTSFSPCVLIPFSKESWLHPSLCLKSQSNFLSSPFFCRPFWRWIVKVLWPDWSWTLSCWPRPWRSPDAGGNWPRGSQRFHASRWMLMRRRIVTRMGWWIVRYFRLFQTRLSTVAWKGHFVL